jgi:tetratricopeptide (TPR) repeat protein
MTDKDIDRRYKEVCNNIAERKLKPAFDLLGKLIAENSLGIYNDEYRNLEETYHYMLKYTVEGINDPERQKVYSKLIVSVFELADKVYESVRMRFSPSAVYEMKRGFESRYISDPDSFIKQMEETAVYAGIHNGEGVKAMDAERLSAAKAYQQRVKRLFLHLWFRDRTDSEELKSFGNFLFSERIIIAYRSFMVSALILSLQRYFNEDKFNLLFTAFERGEPEISQRALVGLLINLYKYDKRLANYPSITGRLKILNEDPYFKQNIETIIIQFIRSRETERIQQKIRDEIIPEMIRISPNLKNKINLDSLMGDAPGEDKNPEWEEIFKDSPGLIDKMEEFSELQMEGVDVFMGSFSMLKTFPFFSEVTNWFMPFFPDNPQITGVVDSTDDINRFFIETINKAPILCNSDKYSFCFSIHNLPGENREILVQGMKAELDQYNELQDSEELVKPGRHAGTISNQYIQDLYRFYKLFPGRAGLEDIFSWRFDFHNKPVLGDILKEDPKILRNIAEYYFAKNYFEEANEVYTELLKAGQSGELHQKIAYCYQKTGFFDKALEEYLKADLYDLNRLWNLKKIAVCYRNLKQPGKALEYYKIAESIDPENLNIELNIGHCLLELGRFEEALKCYFKVEYLASDNKKVWRPIGWCSFLTGKTQQAEKYFLKLIEDEPNKHDFMNMGHVQWSLGRRKDALDYYTKAIGRAGFTEDEFMDVFDEDLPHLLSRGINRDDVPIMLDQLRYFLED